MTKKRQITKRLRMAFKDAAKLSKDEQRAFAAWMQDALDSRSWEQQIVAPTEAVIASAAPAPVMVLEPPAPTCRDEIFACAKTLGKTFTINDVLGCMKSRGTAYKELTIRTNVVSKMVTETNGHPADLERVSQGVYRLKK